MNNKIKSIFWFLLTTSTLSVNAQNWTIFDGSVTPDAATPAWQCNNVPKLSGTTAEGIAEEKTDNAEYYVKNTYTVGLISKQYYFYKMDAPKQKFTFMCRIKSPGLKEKIHGAYFEPTILYNNDLVDKKCFRIKFKTDTTDTLVLDKPDLGDKKLTHFKLKKGTFRDYHTIRITADTLSELVNDGVNNYRIPKSIWKVYIDEDPTPVFDLVSVELNSLYDATSIRMGDMSAATGIDSAIDWMAWTTDGTFEPGAAKPDGVIVDIASSITNPSIEKIIFFNDNINNQLKFKIDETMLNADILVYNTNGVLFYSSKANEKNISISTISLPKGAYILNIKSNQTILANGKFIKQ